MRFIIRNRRLIRVRRKFTRDVAFKYRMPAGIPGDVNRAFHSTIVTEVIWPAGSTGAPPAYGLGMIIDATTGQARVVKAADTAALMRGFLVRPFPLQHMTTDQMSGAVALSGASVPPSEGPCDIMVSGFMTVKLQNTTAAVKGAVIYVRLASPPSGGVIGGVEAAADSSNTIALDGKSWFVGPADADGNVEIAYNI